MCVFYAENVNNKCAHKEIHHDASYTLYFIQVFFTTENISAKAHTKHYINPISVYNTHLCPTPPKKQSFLIFSMYSTRFNQICFFLSTVPKGTSTSRREMGSWAFWHTVWPRSTVFTACEKARCAYSFDHYPKTRTTRLFGLYWWMGGIQANAKGLGFQSSND